MRNGIARTAVLLAAGLAVLPAAKPAPAEKSMRTNIPFTFIAAGHMHPAGEYWVRLNSDFRYVELRSFRSAIAERVALDGGAVPRKGLDSMKGFVQFERYGSAYMLRAVGAPEAGAGLAVKPSKADKELAKANGGGPGTVVNVQ